MKNFSKYLIEKEEEFYSDEVIEEPEDAIEEPEDDYGLDFVDDEEYIAQEIDVEEIPDNSDPILNADEFMHPNAKTMSLYAKGKGFDLTDNQDLYEVVKSVKDMTDKHLYFRNMQWKVDIANRKAVFSFSLGKNGKEENKFFLQSVNQYILTEIFKKFGPLYNIDTKFVKNAEGRDVMKLTVEKDEKEERKRHEFVSTNPLDSASFVTKSSVSRM